MRDIEYGLVTFVMQIFLNRIKRNFELVELKKSFYVDFISTYLPIDNTYTLHRMYVLKQGIHSCLYVVETIKVLTIYYKFLVILKDFHLLSLQLSMLYEIRRDSLQANLLFIRFEISIRCYRIFAR